MSSLVNLTNLRSPRVGSISDPHLKHLNDFILFSLKLLLCDQDTEIWNGFTKLENVEYVKGGLKHMARFLWIPNL